MDPKQSKARPGRPSEVGAPRNKQLTFPVTEDERLLVIDVAVKLGKPLTHFLRDAVLAATEHFQSQSKSLKNISKAANQLTKPAKTVSSAGFGNVPTPAEIPQEDQLVLEMSRTRASERPPARTQKEERDPSGVSSSLRSSQAAPGPAAQVSDPEPEHDDDEPWSDPAPLKLVFKLSTGEVVTNTWLFANGTKIPGPDVTRLLQSSTYKPLKKAMLQCFARSLRDTYRMRWCSAWNRRMNAWKDTPRSNNAFLRAAELLAVQYADRGMTSNQFIDACDEMRPKSVRFVPVDMLAGAIGSRVADWVPPEQRERDKPWTAHVDNSGTTWITPQGEGAAVPVLRTAADRERFLRASKVRG